MLTGHAEHGTDLVDRMPVEIEIENALHALALDPLALAPIVILLRAPALELIEGALLLVRRQRLPRGGFRPPYRSQP
jgi:hypothetical protein